MTPPYRSTVLPHLDGGDVVAWVRDDFELRNGHTGRGVSVNPWPERRVRQQLLEDSRVTRRVSVTGWRGCTVGVDNRLVGTYPPQKN